MPWSIDLDCRRWGTPRVDPDGPGCWVVRLPTPDLDPVVEARVRLTTVQLAELVRRAREG